MTEARRGTDESADVARIVCIKVYVEGMTDEQCDALTDKFVSSLCSVDHSTPEARCPNPWFIVTHHVSKNKARQISTLLNR